MQWNSRGYVNKLPCLQRIVNEYLPGIICLQETWLKPSKNVFMRQYQCPIRRERTQQNCGGVLIFVRDSIPFEPIRYDRILELVGIKVLMGNKQVTVCSLYVPPKFDNTLLMDELEKLKIVLEAPFILTADINAHHYSWGSEFSDARGRRISEWVTDSNYMILYSGDPTYASESRANTHIDITVTDNNFSTMLKWETAPELYNSDYFPIFIGTEINAPLSHRQKRWCLQSANWNGYRDSLELPKIHINPTETCGQNCKSIIHAAHKNDNVRVSEGLANGARKSWWNGACRWAWMKKKAAFNRYKRKRDQIFS